ncbi:MAG: hypothetical protein IRY92_02705, partial [Dactylosporangium sp.]|nr:hypothetical protein [Dactylosporangium sp.]
ELARRGLQDRVPFAAPSVRVSGLELLLLAGFVLALTLAAALAALRPVGPPSAVSASGRRSAAWAVAIAAIGVGGLALAVRVDHDSPRAVLLSVSGALAVTGLALLGTELLFLLAKVRGGPPAFRIGIRDLARHRTRTRGLMIAAIAGLVGGTMAVLALTSLAARDRDTYQPRLRPGQLVLDGANQAQAQQLAQRIGGATLAPVTGAQRTMPSGETGLVLAVRPDGSQGVVAVVDRASLPAYGIPAAAVQGDGTGQAFVLVDDVAAGDVVRLASPGWRRSLTAVPVEPLLHRDSTLPAAVLTREAADALGLLTPTPPTRWVLSKTGPLTNTDWAHINALTAQYTGVAATVEEGWVDHDAAFRRGLNLGVVAFGVLACLLVTVLAEVERARTYGILHSLGCSPGRRRRIAVVSTVVLSVWFAVLATLASIPLTRIALDRTPLVVSWRTLLLNAIAVIAIAALVSMRARTRMSVIEGGTDARGSVAR